MRDTTPPAVSAPLSARSRSAFALLAAATILGCAVFWYAGYSQAVVMGVVQGLGEFLPISSSGHLILAPWFFGWEGGAIGSLTFDISLHLGTLVAVLGYFWRDWIDLMRAVPGVLRSAAGGPRGLQRLAGAERLLVAVALGTIPAAVAGVLIEDWAEQTLRSPALIAFTLAVVGVLLYVVDKHAGQLRSLEHLSWSGVLWIGVAQACALVPGVSRSGATMTMGRMLKLDRRSAARFSFLLSAPITAAAVVFKLPDILTIPSSQFGVFIVGTLVSAAVGALAIHFLLGYIQRAGFGIFAVYRIVLAVVIVAVLVMRG